MKRFITPRLIPIIGTILGGLCALSLVLFASAQVTSSNSTVLSASVAPTISKIWPASGGRLQYVTLEGQHFGSTPGRVVFVRRGVEIASDSDLPGPCQGQTWHDGYVVIKVPAKLELGQYSIKVYRNDNQIVTYNSFIVTSAPPTPGICAVTPDNGPAGIAIKAYGQNFGSTTGRLIVEKGDATIQPNGWADGYIEATTPLLSATSGRIRVVDSNNNLSNPIPFQVGRCTQSMCGESGACCADGSCRANGMCADAPIACTYRWSFFTGELKQLNESCSRNEECTSNMCGPQKKCVRGTLKEQSACTWDPQCVEGLWCDNGMCTSRLRNVAQSCRANEDCMSSRCINNMCAQGTRMIGAVCENAQQCTTNNCFNARCSSAPKKISIIDTQPNSKNAARNSAISFTFNQLIDEESAKSRLRISPYVDGSYQFITIGEGADAKTEIIFLPKGPLDPKKEYCIEAAGGITSVSNNELFSGSQNCITTGTEIKPFDHVSVYVNDSASPSTDDSFGCAKSNCGNDDKNSTLAGNQHRYLAIAYSADDTALSQIKSYSWSVSGDRIVTLPSIATTPRIEITALPANGNATASVTAVQCGDKDCKTDGTSRSAQVYIKNYLCDNLWEFSSQNTADLSLYDFDMEYCRGNDVSHLLPSLLQNPVAVDASTKDRGLFDKEYIFQFADPKSIEEAVDAHNTDVIAMRIADNADKRSPYQWYLAHGTGQNPSSTLVDGFQAVRDTTGVYIAIHGTDNQFYIFSLSYNEGASTTTQGIFATLLQNMNIGGGVAPGQDPGIIRRDMLRLSDMADMESFLSAYRKTTTVSDTVKDAIRYPLLAAGSFFKGQTTSAWPSWQSALGNALHAALPTDPLATTVGGFPQCPKTGGFDPKTCWNAQKGTFGYGTSVEEAVKKTDVHVYTYTTSDGSSYSLCMRLEDPGLFKLTNPYCRISK